MNILKFLKSGYLLLFAVILASYVGLNFPQISKFCSVIEFVYLNYIKMCIIPLLFSLLIISINLLFNKNNISFSLTRIIGSIFSALLASSCLALVFSYFTSMVAQNVAKNPAIALAIYNNTNNNIQDLALDDPISSINNHSFQEIFMGFVPSNLFESFATGNIFQIVILSVLIGVGTSSLNQQNMKTFIDNIKMIRDVFKKLLDYSILFLPLGLFSIIVSGIASVDITILYSIIPFYAIALSCMLLIVFISLLALISYSPLSLWASIKTIKKPIAISFSTGSTQASLPYLINAFQEKLNFCKTDIDLALPLVITIARLPVAAYYSLAALFSANLCNIPLGFSEYALIIFGSFIASIAASGGVCIGITMINIILLPLGVPFSTMSVILMVVDPIIDPFRSAASLITTTAVSCFILNKKKHKVLAA